MQPSRIKTIINNYRAQLEAAGLLKPVGTNPVSAKIKTLRPSLGKVSAALIERSDRFALVQPSPFSILFDVTLPRIEHLLFELGKEKAEQIISQLIEHGQKMIKENGLSGAREHLEDLFIDLPLFEAKLREAHGGEAIIKAYIQRDCFGWAERYLTLALGAKIKEFDTEDGSLLVIMKAAVMEPDLIFLRKVNDLRLHLAEKSTTDAELAHLGMLTNLCSINLSWNQITDAGLDRLRPLTNLRSLNLWMTKVTDAGLAHLSVFSDLRFLNLEDLQVTDAGLVHLQPLTNLRSLSLRTTRVTDAGLTNLAPLIDLKLLDLRNTQITDAGLAHLRPLINLQSLNLMHTKVGDAGLEQLRALPCLQALSLTKTQTTDKGIQILKATFPDLVIEK